MKFGKEFTAQMCQEWQQAYMDYNLLKSILKDILTFRQQHSQSRNQSTPASPTSSPSPSIQEKANSLRRKVSLYRAFSGLTTRYRSSPRKRDEEAILVSAVRRRSVESPAAGDEEQYQTMFMMPSDEGGEQELEFFRRLDEELNKVISFYRKKVGEVVDEADELTRQMNALIALRIKIQNPTYSCTPTHTNNVNKPGGKRMDAIQEVELTSEEEGHGRRHLAVGSRPASLEILDHVKINVAPDTPISKLRGILTCSSSLSKDQLKKSEELMVQAFVEFYHKLRLLKSFCFMNQLGFSKIMKKYDKVTQRNASRAYLDMIDKSYLNTCDEVIMLMERVEKAFVKHFSNGNRRNGMSVLRPKQRKERHTVTFYLGLLVGCSLALVVTILVLIQSRNIIQSQGRTKYMDNIFPLYSLFGYIVLHMIMFSMNIYYWRRYRINYPFIFGLKEGTDLSYREVFLLSAGLSVLSLAAVISSLDMDLNPETRSYDTFREVVPLILIGVLLLITFCPFNTLYRSSRYFVILTMYHCLLAPFYKVSLADFFMGDQLTSQVQALRCLLFYVFYYIWGDFRRREPGTFEDDNNVYKAMYIVVAIFPYWWRFLQCVRRLVEEKGSMHALNGLKYFLIIIAVVVRTTFEQKNNAFSRPGNPTGVQRSVIVLLQILAAVTSSVATIYATYWDIVVDWGLLRRKSTNRWLRDKLIIPNKAVYFVAIVLNCLLRLAWMQTVLGIREAPFIHRKALIAIVAILEIIRRGLWNFFRIENEHLNNVGKYRAFKSVPLPFNYYDDDQKSS